MRSLFIANFVFWFCLFDAPTSFSAAEGFEDRRALAQTVADGELHDCQVLSIDRIIAVGDRGLILATDNGGKSWTVRRSRSDHTLHSVHFANDLDGCIVGGLIEPLTLRSRGIILLTNDGGKNWRPSKTELPRLTGIVTDGRKRWIAWGDWSLINQSALFESVDGGETWTPLASPCGHIESAAFSSTDPSTSKRERHSARGNEYGLPTKVILVDRLSRCFRSLDGVNYEPFSIATATAEEPIRCCYHDGIQWWLAGDHGQLYRSYDGKEWKRCLLPGQPQDHKLIGLRNVVSNGDEVWVCGEPGSVVWRSMDQGATWAVHQGNGKLRQNSVSWFQGDIVATCGPFATISVSRNDGKAWRLLHQSSSRTSTLNIASRADTVAWDLLATVSRDGRQTSGIVVVHDQNIEQRSSHLPEQASRTNLASKRLEVASGTTLPMFPISDALPEPRTSDLSYYSEVGSMHTAPQSELFRRLVYEIRQHQPDMLVTDCSQSSHPVDSKLSQAVDLATTWSSRRDYQLFSADSGILNEPWELQRTIYRSHDRGNKSRGRQFHAAMPLKNTGTILGEALGPVFGIAYGVSKTTRDNAKHSYRASGDKQTNLLNPLEGLVLGQGTQLNERLFGSSRAGLVMVTSKWFDPNQLLQHQTANPFVRDIEWETKLQQASKGVEPEARAIVLLDVAKECRRNGNWNLWASSLELLLSTDNSSPYAEAAFRELLIHHGSAEVGRMISTMLQSQGKRVGADSEVSTSVVLQSSPFSKESEAHAVKPANYAHVPRLIPIASQSGLPEFTRLLTKFPESWKEKRSEPEWAWMIASRYRAYRLGNGSSDDVNLQELLTQSANFWPLLSTNLLSWQVVLTQETKLLQTADPNRKKTGWSIPRIPVVSERPYLDGLRNESLWNESQTLDLKDVWGGGRSTYVSLCRDQEFLYVLSESEGNESPQSNGKARQRDGLNPSTDHVRLRLDIDRDYETWFELGWNRNGDTVDQCNDMMNWDPTWHIATVPTKTGWNAEIAIPLAELVTSVDRLESSGPIAINAIHSIPGAGSRVVSPAVSDRFQSDQWTLIGW